jgi:hypothetical protein
MQIEDAVQGSMGEGSDEGEEKEVKEVGSATEREGQIV